MPGARYLALCLVVSLLGMAFLLLEFPGAAGRSEVTGIVTDDDGPVAGASVRFKGHPHRALTDDQGRFCLRREPGTGRVVASQSGYFIAGASFNFESLILHLTRIPEGDYADYSWVDSSPDPEIDGNCANCHQEIHREWQESGHARSSNNRRFVNLYEGTDWHGRIDRGWNLLKENPDGAGVCASCHGPTLPTIDFDIRAATKKVPVGLSGVHCDFCHKVEGPGSGEWGLTHGRYQLQLKRPDLTQVDQLFFGPLDDVDRGDDTASAFQRNSELCTACHEGTVFGVQVYTTYSEWLESPARQKGQSCQSCHMAPTGKMTNIAPGHGGIERHPKSLGNHRFFAGSQLAMLKNALSIEVSTAQGQEGLSVKVQLTAQDVGHRVPTGFIDHHLILHVEADRPQLAGPRLSRLAGKQLAGQPGKIYAKILKDEKEKSPIPFWRGQTTLTDNRLEPGKTDVNEFIFPEETSAIRVRVYYRRFWDEVAKLKGWPDDDLLVAGKSDNGGQQEIAKTSRQN